MALTITSNRLPRYSKGIESVGQIIVSSGKGMPQAWWPRGPALNRFESDILPEIKNITKRLDLCYADVFIRLYMIGRTPEKANPVVLICSINRDAREEAERTIRASGILTKHQGFGLATAAEPLYYTTPSRRLIGLTAGHENALPTDCVLMGSNSDELNPPEKFKRELGAPTIRTSQDANQIKQADSDHSLIDSDLRKYINRDYPELSRYI